MIAQMDTERQDKIKQIKEEFEARRIGKLNGFAC